MESLFTEIVTAGGAVAALLGLAIIFLWRELKSERAERVKLLERHILEKDRYIEDYSEFKVILRDMERALIAFGPSNKN